jgi:tetratricopeptide (TPR) repeat protein
MRSNILASGLAVVLGMGSPIVGAVVMPEMAIAQQTSEIDRAIEEGERLIDEGSQESLVKANTQFKTALHLSQLENNQVKKALAFHQLGYISNLLGENQKALDYYNQALLIRRVMGKPLGEATTLNNIGRVYADLGEKKKSLDYYNQALLIRRTVGDYWAPFILIGNSQ